MTPEIELLGKIGALGPGFAVAAYLYLHGRRDRETADKERQAERELERAREREHMQLIVDMNAHLLETVNANTRAITGFEALMRQMLQKEEDEHGR